MTRGQESLVMDLEPAAAAAALAVAGERPPLRVLRAGTDELAEHARVLAEIAKESKGKCLWQAEAASAA
jgi:DNA polymerase-3 subunit epsilon